MPNLNFINHALPGDLANLTPLAARIPVAVALTGLSRSEIYRQAAVGKIRLIKSGKSTLVDMESARAHLASLPEATIGGAK